MQINYPGIGLGFMRIVVEPLTVTHRDNWDVCWKWGYGEERIWYKLSNRSLLYTTGTEKAVQGRMKVLLQK